jgi:hypothetical protein
MAESANILTKLQDLLVYLIAQLNKFPRDQKFVLGDRIETKLLDVQEDCLRAYSGRDKRGHLLEANLQRKWRGIWCGWLMPWHRLCYGWRVKFIPSASTETHLRSASASA